MRTLAATATLAVVLMGCGSEGTTDGDPAADTTETSAPAEQETEQAAYSDECGSAMEAASAVGAMEDTVEDTDPAIVACADVEAFTAASVDHPDALDGTDVTTWLSNRCLYTEDEAVKSSAICAEIGG